MNSQWRLKWNQGETWKNDSHPRSLENAAPIVQNGELSQPVQPENDTMLFMRQLLAQITMMDQNNSSRMDAMSRKMDENSRKMDMMEDEIKREMSEAMGREMVVVREEVRECRIRVREEVRPD